LLPDVAKRGGLGKKRNLQLLVNHHFGCTPDELERKSALSATKGAMASFEMRPSKLVYP